MSYQIRYEGNSTGKLELEWNTGTQNNSGNESRHDAFETSVQRQNYSGCQMRCSLSSCNFPACFKRYWQHLLFDLDILKGRVDIKPFFEISNQLDVHFSRYCHRFLWVANYILTTSKSGVKNTYTCVSFFKQMWDEVLVAIRQSDMRKFWRTIRNSIPNISCRWRQKAIEVSWVACLHKKSLLDPGYCRRVLCLQLLPSARLSVTPFSLDWSIIFSDFFLVKLGFSKQIKGM